MVVARDPDQRITERPETLELLLPDESATAWLGQWLAEHLGAGDTLLLSGAIGAGKTHLARSLIQHALASAGPVEDVPSPTFTLIQHYHAGALPIIHADLYRLSGTDELVELGLDEAFGAALCIVEWPDRLGTAVPSDALELSLAVGSVAGLDFGAAVPRHARLRGGKRWLIDMLSQAARAKGHTLPGLDQSRCEDG